MPVSATAAPPYGFLQWEGDVVGTTTPISLTMNEDYTVAARFVQQVELTMAVQGGGTTDPAADPGNLYDYDYPQVVPVSAMPAAGWLFHHWESSLTTDSIHGSHRAYDAIALLNAVPRTLTAVFAEKRTLTTSVQGNGKVSPNGMSWRCHGDTVKLVATAHPYWKFDHWEGALSGSANPAYLTMNADYAVTAVFVADPNTSATLTMDVFGFGPCDPKRFSDSRPSLRQPAAEVETAASLTSVRFSQ